MGFFPFLPKIQDLEALLGSLGDARNALEKKTISRNSHNNQKQLAFNLVNLNHHHRQ